VSTGNESNVREVSRVELDAYLIEIKMHGYTYDREKKRSVHRDYRSYFKADRYTCFAGRLQTESDHGFAKHFKTAKGAQAAIDRLTAKGTIKPCHCAKVVHVVHTQAWRFESISPPPSSESHIFESEAAQ
jgi:hypothetical protein